MSTTAFSSGHTISGSGVHLPAVLKAVLAAWSRHKTEMLLADLDDHILRDIGVNPSEMRRPRNEIRDWVIDGRVGPARLVFIGR